MTDTTFEIETYDPSWCKNCFFIDCNICGGSHDTFCRLNNGNILVCADCVESGDIDGELIRHAERLEAQAQKLRLLKGQLKVPSSQEWQTALEHDKAETEAAAKKPHPIEKINKAARRFAAKKAAAEGTKEDEAA
jgi:hypothetical protein